MSNITLGLILDTSNERSLLVLAKDSSPIAFLHLQGGPGFSSILFPSLLELLKNAHLSLEDFHYIATSLGPGSYTNLRTGASIAQALAFSLQIPLIGFSSFMGFFPEKEGSFVVMMDAKISGFYFLKGKKEKNALHYFCKPSLISPKELPIALSDVEQILSPHQEKIKSSLPPEFVSQKHWQDAYPNEQRLAKLSLERFQNKQFSSTQELSYLRNP